MSAIKIQLADGKYTYIRHEDYRQEALRYGEPWRDLVGDNFVWAMADELTAANERIKVRNTENDLLLRRIGELVGFNGKNVVALTAEREVSDKLERALELVLPMAKGYAVANRVGSNDAYIKLAAAALTEVAAIRSKGEKQ